tara:strand:+ start:200 stop:835 length:636 start_codon:yes stop_codon:yes gene_type:complete
MNVSPRTLAQHNYVKTLKCSSKSIVIATGPAGTGKTLLACHIAIEKLHSKDVKKVILTRPIVSVDEELGFLPGDIKHKMEPWTRPVMDILHNYYNHSKVAQLMKDNVVEIAPLAYMRGRTFDDAYIIADEMQNSTIGQMKMLLTRLGESSNIVVTGDVQQCDLENDIPSGLTDIIDKIDSVELEYIKHILLTNDDVQRSPAVKEVLTLYDL